MSSLPHCLVLAVLTVIVGLATGEDVFVDLQLGTVQGMSVDFIENKFINKSTKINVFKGRSFSCFRRRQFQSNHFGESAGAGSVDFHLISKFSRDLFDQAILESGAVLTPWSFNEYWESNKVNEAFRLGRSVNCSSTDTTELVDCLRQIDARTLENIASANQIRFGPTVDGKFLDESPITMIQRGDFKDCPVIVGFNRDEGTLFMLSSFPDYALTEEAPVINQSSFNMLVTVSQTIYNPVRYEIVEDSIKQQYVDWAHWDDTNHDYFDTIVGISGDESFSCPCLKVARDRAMMTSVFIVYGNGPGWLGAGHAEELQYVFGFPFIPGRQEWHGPMTDSEAELSVKFMQFWTNFAKSGDPSRPDSNSSPGQGDWEWPAFTIPGLQYKELASEMSVDRGLKADECAFWDGFKPDLTSYIASIDTAELEWREEFSGWQKDLEDWRMAFQEYQEDPVCDP
ncbi:putative cholinesterase 1 [Apostichopus japonicus]|uniref:Putative cholinesterase 1 n=1 Tax=Stichopus japonicus TaxID=307972 RepID=A0A2G8LLD4_STIJA|nr:putative cholinesterase 1 [Apostichopus japonicus]